MHQSLGFVNADPVHDGFQYIEDIATAYWYSEVLFTALDLKIFMYLDQGGRSVRSLAVASSCREGELSRLLRGMERMALVSCVDNIWMNCQVASRHLVPGKKDYMGDFFLYRRYMQPNWSRLTEKVVAEVPPEIEKLSYSRRNNLYVNAMDTQVRQKAKEIVACLDRVIVGGPVLDVGGGAGSMIRALQAAKPGLQGVLFDIPEVIAAARELYPEPSHWGDITSVEGDFRSHEFENRFALIILSNFLHAYGQVESRELLLKALTLLDRRGLIVIHDYFPDRRGSSPQKGSLYDLSMMLNTFNGTCHESGTILQWLGEAGIKDVSVRDLGSDTSIILAGGDPRLHIPKNPWVELAYREGFDKAMAIDPKEVVTGSWVQKKCRYGCGRFGKNLQCPPHAMVHTETRSMLDDYTSAVLVQGQPPGRQFHEKLLRLEKGAFLAGRHKAFVFGAGPCPVCPECPEDGRCRFHNLARPSMEGAGIDVYATADRAGWSLAPVKAKGDYIKYIGLLLVS
ncbi:MAG: DUF2284 domain-containing protein [Desulforhopalus sp.]